jgi:hypothetical protein
MVEIAQDKPYRELMQVFARHPIGCYESETFIEILKFYYEPEEAHLAAHMGWDLEPEEDIAKRAGVSLDDAARLLTTMASKFFIRGIKRPDGVRVFRLPFILPGLFEMPFVVRQPSPELDRLGYLWEKYFEEGWGREFNSSPIQFARALPAINAPKEQVMPYEDAAAVVMQASYATINPCQCRQAKRGCGDPSATAVATPATPCAASPNSIFPTPWRLPATGARWTRTCARAAGPASTAVRWAPSR